MGNKFAPPYTCLVVSFKEETKFFPIELPKYFSTEEIQIIKKVFRRYMDNECLNNLHPSINYTYEKVARNEKGNLVQILNFLDVNVSSVKQGNLAHFLVATLKSIIKHTRKAQFSYPYLQT